MYHIQRASCMGSWKQNFPWCPFCICSDITYGVLRCPCRRFLMLFHVFTFFFLLPAQCLDISVVYANCHRGNMFERCELDKRNRSRFYSIWETQSSCPCDVAPCDIQRTVLWKNLSHVEMRLERVKNHKPTAIDTRRCHRKHYQMTNEFA